MRCEPPARVALRRAARLGQLDILSGVAGDLIGGLIGGGSSKDAARQQHITAILQAAQTNPGSATSLAAAHNLWQIANQAEGSNNPAVTRQDASVALQTLAQAGWSNFQNAQPTPPGITARLQALTTTGVSSSGLLPIVVIGGVLGLVGLGVASASRGRGRAA
jgi:hypothetical protein